MNDKPVKIGRLALRQEGQAWNAYYAMPDTMEGALLLGYSTINAAKHNPKIKRAFIDLMRDVVADILEDTTGERPTWSGEYTAPEHERAGNA